MRPPHPAAGPSLRTNRHGVRCVERDGALIATIADHRYTSRRLVPTVQNNWAVLWVTGRVDWHHTLQQAKACALRAA